MRRVTRSLYRVKLHGSSMFSMFHRASISSTSVKRNIYVTGAILLYHAYLIILCYRVKVILLSMQGHFRELQKLHSKKEHTFRELRTLSFITA